jgi:hypothetical protein
VAEVTSSMACNRRPGENRSRSQGHTASTSHDKCIAIACFLCVQYAFLYFCRLLSSLDFFAFFLAFFFRNNRPPTLALPGLDGKRSNKRKEQKEQIETRTVLSAPPRCSIFASNGVVVASRAPCAHGDRIGADLGWAEAGKPRFCSSFFFFFLFFFDFIFFF